MTPLSRIPAPLAYALLPFLVHAGLDRPLLPRAGASGSVAAEGMDGTRFELDPTDEIAREILHFGAYERRSIEILRRLAETDAERRGGPGVLLDIGANLGNHTVLLAARFARVLAAEPNPPTHERLVRNVGLNDLGHVVVVDVGLSDREAEVGFEPRGGGNPGASRIVDASSSAATSTIRVRPGDALVAELGLAPVSMIKIDVEGHEERVIAGLSATIARDRPLVAFEWEAGRNGPGCLDRLEGYSFRAQPWELSPRWWRPFARGLDAVGPPRLVPVTRADLDGRYVGMVVAVPDTWGEMPVLAA
jgi:FkbM family methyltransferase